MAPNFEPPQITEETMNKIVKYGLPALILLAFVWWVWSSAKRNRKF